MGATETMVTLVVAVIANLVIFITAIIVAVRSELVKKLTATNVAPVT